MLSAGIALLCFTYQDKTGPTQPFTGDFQTANGTVHFKFLRSENIGTGLQVMIEEPVPAGVTAFVDYRRHKSDDTLSRVYMEPGEFHFTRRGSHETVSGLGARLPSLQERAGKYEYFVFIDDGEGDPVSVTGESPILARYKAAVPTGVIIVHILVIFASMMIAIRTVLEALLDGKFRELLWATIVSLLLGGFVLGPIVQWYAFGVWWAGVPFGYDWTDNKVLVELVFWILAAWANRGVRRNRASIYLAGVVTLLVYFIPHSIFGSEYDYRSGTGHGTAG